MAEPDRMTAWQFIRWYASNATRPQLAFTAAAETISLGMMVWVAIGLGLLAWAVPVAVAALILFNVAIAWLVLGSHRVQQWIIGPGGREE